ncbi:hypothetical protein [Winogradskyella tangerina]|uniref:hypothetical protein n=1 Tax=Winogradskyella tangerina TaxID=2023240 RepID=UPI000DBE617C|nr:hypothetical protein [Winogradskyella tangerina]
MKTFKALFLVLFSIQFSIAQQTIDSAYFFENQKNGRDSQKTYKKQLTKAIESSTDFQWQKATLETNGNLEDVTARYNPFIDEIEIKSDQEYYQLAKTKGVKVLFIDTKLTYVVKSFSNLDDEDELSYFIADSKLENENIFIKRSYELGYGRNNGSYKDTKNKKLIVTDHFILLDANEKLNFLTTNKSLIRKNYPNHKKAIIKYIKQNKLKTKNKADLVQLATYIKSLKVNS